MKRLSSALTTHRQFLAGLLILSGTAWAQEALPVFSLMPADVPKIVIIATKPDQVVLEVTYSKPKQGELLKMTQTGLPKKIGITLNGKPVWERTATAPSSGHSLKIPIDSLDTAFALAESLVPSASPAASSEAVPTDTGTPPPTFTLLPDDVTKIAVFAFPAKRVFLDLSFTSEKRAELAALVADSPAQSIRFVANGSLIAERPVTADAVPRALRLDLPSLAAAFSQTRFLMNAPPAPASSARTEDASSPSIFQ